MSKPPLLTEKDEQLALIAKRLESFKEIPSTFLWVGVRALALRKNSVLLPFHLIYATYSHGSALCYLPCIDMDKDGGIYILSPRDFLYGTHDKMVDKGLQTLRWSSGMDLQEIIFTNSYNNNYI